ncbi:hypothetical protein NTGM5_120036 [Candidatus Nitrotoga sp. M5]|nr:hypothetical protein NTGM5_120036 [Candidatus Nitrotoga sp. M5]
MGMSPNCYVAHTSNLAEIKRSRLRIYLSSVCIAAYWAIEQLMPNYRQVGRQAFLSKLKARKIHPPTVKFSIL